MLSQLTEIRAEGYAEEDLTLLRLRGTLRAIWEGAAWSEDRDDEGAVVYLEDSDFRMGTEELLLSVGVISEQNELLPEPYELTKKPYRIHIPVYNALVESINSGAKITTSHVVVADSHQGAPLTIFYAGFQFTPHA